MYIEGDGPTFQRLHELMTDPIRARYFTRLAEAFRLVRDELVSGGREDDARKAHLGATAFFFHTTDQAAKGKRFIPLFRIEGQEWPDRSNLPEGFREYLEAHADSPPNNRIEAWVKDLLWDIYPGHERGLQALAAYRRVVELLSTVEFEHSVLDLLDAARRMNQLAKTFKQDQQTCLDLSWRCVDDALDQERWGGVVHLSEALIPFLSRDQGVISALETSAEGFARNGQYFQAAAAIDRAIGAAKRFKDHDLRGRLVDRLGRLYESQGDTFSTAGGGLVAHGWYQQAHQYFAQRQAKDDMARLKKKMEESLARGVGELKPISVPLSPERLKVQEWAASLVEHPETALECLATAGVASIDWARSVDEWAEKNTPLSHLILPKVIGAGGSVTTPLSVGELETAHLFDQLQVHSQIFLASRMLPGVQALRDKEILSGQWVVSCVEGSSIMRDDERALLSHAVDRILADDRVSAMHLLPPLSERLLRNALEELQCPTTRVVDGEVRPVDIDAALDDPTLAVHLGEDLEKHMRLVLSSPYGWNIRNHIAHGNLGFAQMSGEACYLALHAILALLFHFKPHRSEPMSDVAPSP